MSNFGDINSGLAIGAGQSVRRNAGDTAFEPYTPGNGDMGKSIYDPENGSKQVAFKENVYSKTETYNKTEVNNLLKNVGVNLFTLTETVVINSVTYAQSCILQTDPRYNSNTTSELTTAPISNTLDGIGAVSDEGIFSSLPETTATIHFYARKTASNQADSNAQFKWYKLTSAGVATLIGTSSIATIDSTITKEYDLTIILTPTTFAPTDRFLRIPTYTKVGGGVDPQIAVSVEGPSNYTFVTIPVGTQNISVAHNDLTNKGWIIGGHTGTANTLAGFGTSGEAVEYGISNFGLVGTKQVDETAISNDKILVYNSTSGKLEYQIKPSGGGLAWGASITGTTGTGLTSTVGDSAVAGTIGQSIVIGNTQTNSVTGLKIDLGTSAKAHNGILINNVTGSGSGSNGILINHQYNGAVAGYGIKIDMGAISQTYAGLFITWSGANVKQTGRPMVYSYYNPNSGNSSSSSATNVLFEDYINYGSGFAQTDSGITTHIKKTIARKNSTGAFGFAGDTLRIELTEVSPLGGGAYSNTVNVLNLISSVGLKWNGRFINCSNSANGIITEKTNDTVLFDYSRTNTATSLTITDNYNLQYLKRTSVQNGAGGTFVSNGSVQKLENIATQTAGALNDTVVVLDLVQTSTTSNGGHIKFNAYTPGAEASIPNNTFWYNGTDFKFKDNAGTVRTINKT